MYFGARNYNKNDNIAYLLEIPPNSYVFYLILDSYKSVSEGLTKVPLRRGTDFLIFKLQIVIHQVILQNCNILR